MDIYITKSEDGMSVLDYLRKEIGVSGAMLRHLKFMENGITVDGRHVTVRHILSAGELLSIQVEDREPSENIIPSDITLDVAYEDERIVVPDKPPFMPTHPSHGHHDDTVANALAYRYRDAEIPFVFRPVNRLDRNTSGLLLIARDRMSAARLFASMKRGEIKKQYIAILDGVPSEKSGRIESYMKRTDESIIVRRVCGEDEGGDYALTEYKVLFSHGGHSLVAAAPVTGRTHQLRVHFAHIGCPIAGDDMYGNESPYIKRHALHSAKLSFSYPENDCGSRPIRLFSPLPSDMQEIAKRLFGESGYEQIRAAMSRFEGEDLFDGR